MSLCLEVHRRWPARVAWVFALLVTLLMTRGAAAEHPEPAPRNVIAAVPRDWPPDYSLDAQGTPRGFAIDVLNAVARRAHLRVTYKIVDSFPEAFALLRSGHADLIPTVGVLEERKQEMLFTNPVETHVVSLFVRKNSAKFRGLDQLHGHRVGVVEANVGAVLVAAHKKLHVRRYHDARSALFALLAGDVDALIYPKPVMNKLARDVEVADRIQAVGAPLYEVKRAIAVRHDEPELLQRLNAATRSFVRSPAYRAAYVKWYADKRPLWTVHRVTYVMLGLVALVLVGMMLWRYASLMRINQDLRRSIEARERAERARQQSETSYRLLMEQASDGIVVCDSKGKPLDVNPRLCEMLGYTRAELLEQSTENLLALARPQAFSAAGPGPTKSLLSERLLSAKDGHPVPVEVSSTRLEDGRVQAILRDITERKRAEAALREREEQLRQSQKLEAIGRLAGGVAHDFNNLLTAIAGNTELLHRKLGADSGLQEEIQGIREAADRATGLTRQLLAFSRRQLLRPQVLDLREVVENIEKMLRRVIGEDIQLTTIVAGDLWMVRADRSQLEQIVMNLAVNARDAMPHGGKLVLRTANAELDETPALEHEGQYVLLEVSDTGAGMDAATRSRIFEPFFTTKPEGKGTGLGLATVYGIVQQSGGFIQTQSKLGQGTTFRVYLPRASAPSPQLVPTSHRKLGAGHETILLVEDEPQVRQVMARTLRSQGYQVLEARSAEDALQTAHQYAGDFHLLVTDIVMPGKNGKQLAAQLQKEWEGLRVLFVSGYTNQVLTANELQPGVSSFLAKPFTPDTLGLAVRDLLDQSAPAETPRTAASEPAAPQA